MTPHDELSAAVERLREDLLAMLRALTALRAENERLRRDKERLDWLETGGRLAYWSDGWECCLLKDGRGFALHKANERPTARDAIDASMALGANAAMSARAAADGGSG
jgi:hypothetical protein